MHKLLPDQSPHAAGLTEYLCLSPFARHADMITFMRQKDQADVFKHILACLREIVEILDVDHSQDVDVGVTEQHDTYDSDD